MNGFVVLYYIIVVGAHGWAMTQKNSFRVITHIHVTGGGPVLKNANLGSRLEVVLWALSHQSATFLKCFFY